MRKVILSIGLLTLMLGLIACSNSENNNMNDDELVMIDVDFQVPETADVDETVELKSTVTYKDEPVTDADVEFEIWLKDDEENSEKIEPTNNEDGTYTLEYTFDEAGVYEMYAHTTAKNMHNMPKKEIKVGDVEAASTTDTSTKEAEHFETEGFDLHFSEPDHIMIDEDTEFITHITLEDQAYEDLSVQYEIQFEDNKDDTDWVKTEEIAAGEYEGDYTFKNPGEYQLTIHVKDNDSLHEHTEQTITVHQ